MWSVECGVVRRGERASEKEKPPTLVGLWSSCGQASDTKVARQSPQASGPMTSATLHHKRPP